MMIMSSQIKQSGWVSSKSVLALLWTVAVVRWGHLVVSWRISNGFGQVVIATIAIIIIIIRLISMTKLSQG